MTDQKHYLIGKLKELANTLNRVPMAHEFTIMMPRVDVAGIFGSHDKFLSAAGLNADQSRKKSKFPVIDNADKIRDIVSGNNLQKKIEFNAAKKILVIGDAHFPFVNNDALNACYHIIENEKPDVICQNGDLKDQYSYSKFPRSLNVYTPQAEDELSDIMAREMWAKIRKLAPKAELFQLTGNHDSRALKRVVEKWPEGEHIVERAMQEKMTFDGVTTIRSQKEELVINDIVFIHGHYGKLGAHRDYNRTNVVCAHSHKGGVDYRSYDGKVFWELNAGYVGDPYSKALTYRHQRFHNWTHGCGLIDKYGPRFVNF